MNPCHVWETRHAGGSELGNHRHASAYAALVLDGCYSELTAHGPLDCTRGLIVLHPAWHTHGNRFGTRDVRTLNVVLPEHLNSQRAFLARNIREADETMRRTPAEFAALLRSCIEVDVRRPLPGWQAEFVRRLGSGAEIRALAREVGISPQHASRSLRATFGMSPRELRRELRWQTALRLLREPVDLAAVADLSGFADQSHLSRWCRRQTGLTLGHLRSHINCVQDLGDAKHDPDDRQRECECCGSTAANRMGSIRAHLA